jgi:hypothetical protein
MAEKHDYQRFKPKEIARSFPETAETLLILKTAVAKRNLR